jgi:hypothetical protein
MSDLDASGLGFQAVVICSCWPARRNPLVRDFPSPSTSCCRWWLGSWPLLGLAVLFQLLECGLPDLLMLLMGSAQLVVGGVLEREH